MAATDQPAAPLQDRNEVVLKPGTPLKWRLAIGVAILLIVLIAFASRKSIGPRGQAFAGLFCFFGVVAMFSTNLRIVNWRTIFWGIVLQIALALLVLKVPFVNHLFGAAESVVVNFISFS